MRTKVRIGTLPSGKILEVYPENVSEGIEFYFTQWQLHEEFAGFSQSTPKLSFRPFGDTKGHQPLPRDFLRLV